MTIARPDYRILKLQARLGCATPAIALPCAAVMQKQEQYTLIAVVAPGRAVLLGF
jgi:hypothetical protein